MERTTYLAQLVELEHIEVETEVASEFSAGIVHNEYKLEFYKVRNNGRTLCVDFKLNEYVWTDDGDAVDGSQPVKYLERVKQWAAPDSEPNWCDEKAVGEWIMEGFRSILKVQERGNKWSIINQVNEKWAFHDRMWDSKQEADAFLEDHKSEMMFAGPDV